MPHTLPHARSFFSLVAIAIGLAFAATQAQAATYLTADGTSGGYVGDQTNMQASDGGVSGDPTLYFNVTSGYFQSSQQTYSNTDFYINNLTLNNGYSNTHVWFTGTGHGSGSIANATSAGLGADFVFTGNMQDYSGSVTWGSNNLTTVGLGNNSSIFQYGGTTSGGTVALGTVTTDGTGKWINNVAGTGKLTINNLIFNYGTDASYDYVKVTNAIATQNSSVSVNFTGNANVLASGVISGTGALNKSGTGTLTLSGANTFTGTATIDGGKLTITDARSLGGSTGANGPAIKIKSGTLDLGFNSSTGCYASNTTNFALRNGNLTMGGTAGGTSTLSSTGVISGKPVGFAVGPGFGTSITYGHL